MSGGGGSYSTIPSQYCACDSLVLTAILQSPVPSVVKLLKVGDVLQVIKKGTQGPVVAVHNNVIVGSIVNRIVEILNCIDEGTTYEAHVKDIMGLQVKVEVRPI